MSYFFKKKDIIFKIPNIFMNFSDLNKKTLHKTYRDYNTKIGYNVNTSCKKQFKTLLESYLFDKYEAYVIRRNQFPYCFLNAEHYLLWINPKYEKFYSETRIRSIICSHFKNRLIKFWENPLELRSIRSIKHYHIIAYTDYSSLYI